MLWVDIGSRTGRLIYVIPGNPLDIAAGPQDPPYAVFTDTWYEGEPVDNGLTPPPGCYEPQRGFGKLWREHPEVRAQLGWAIAPEQPGAATHQPWSAGGNLLALPFMGCPTRFVAAVYAFGPQRRLEIVNPLPLRSCGFRAT
jgi:hypothetical protein